MELKTEVIFNDELLEQANGIIPLAVGDIFYFSIRGTSPRSEDNYIKLMDEFKESFLRSYIDDINQRADKYHIKQFIVTKLSNSYNRDYSASIESPSVVFTRSITVEEYNEEKEARDKKIIDVIGGSHS